MSKQCCSNVVYLVLKMKYLFTLLVFCFLELIVGLEISDDCQILHDIKHIMKNGDPNNNMQIGLYGRRYKRLFLLSSSDDHEHEALNRKIIKWGKTLGFMFETVYIPKHCSDGNQFFSLTATEALSKYYEVINLKVNIPFNYIPLQEEEDNFNKSKGRHTFSLVGGTYTEDKEQDVCKSIKDYEIDGDYEICKDTKEKITLLYGKLISNSIKSYKLLNEILVKINSSYNVEEHDYWKKYTKVTKNEPIKRQSIVICTNQEIQDRNGIEQYNRHIIYDCNNVNDFIEHDVLAVIAPKPFHGEDFTYLPVIFYDDMAPYLLPNDKVKYPNSTTLYGNFYPVMSYHLMKFIQMQSWKRIAIVSDDSLYTSDFEELMTNIFLQNNLVYSAHQCSGPKCNFDEALKWLKNADARIIIANVDEKYATNIMYTAKKLNLTMDEGVLWIFRAPSLEKLNPYFDYIFDTVGEILYVTVRSEDFAVFDEEKNKKQIIQALAYLEDALSRKKNKSVKIQNSSSTLIEDVEALRKQTSVYIRKITRKKRNDPLHECEIVFNITNRRKPFFKKLSYMDRDQSCDLKSFGFDYTCEDSYPLIMLIVMILFLLAILLIIIIYKKLSPRCRNYRHF